MILHSDPISIAKPTAGLSLLEALIALAILALVMGLSASAFRGPSPALRLQKEAATLIGAATALRQRAILENKALKMGDSAVPCEETDKPLTFFPDGTASSPDLCLTAGDLHLRLTLNALTGRLSQSRQ